MLCIKNAAVQKSFANNTHFLKLSCIKKSSYKTNFIKLSSKIHRNPNAVLYPEIERGNFPSTQLFQVVRYF